MLHLRPLVIGCAFVGHPKIVGIVVGFLITDVLNDGFHIVGVESKATVAALPFKKL